MPTGGTSTIELADLRTPAGLLLAAAAAHTLLPGHVGLSCPLRSATGIPCPLCGMTTSAAATLRLHLVAASRANPLGIVAVLAALVVVVLRPRGTFALPMWVVVLVLLSSWLFELVRFSIL